jgi:hypothetical protein
VHRFEEEDRAINAAGEPDDNNAERPRGQQQSNAATKRRREQLVLREAVPVQQVSRDTGAQKRVTVLLFINA